MKKILASATLAVACILGVAAAPASAAPILNITFDPNPVIGSSDALVDVFGEIENTSTDEVAEIQISWTGGFGVDFLQSLDTLFLTIAGGGTFTGLIGQFQFPTGSVGDTGTVMLDVMFNLYDSPLVGPSLQFETAEFTATVPEPASMTLFGLALAGAAFARRRR
ncbi:MAG: PEP-CTERM sorting domain-containing protein [Acidobacteria bacterium]|nr:PEP-CTERM sorting domain-containing protein [Acidobacteriota bacterium]